MRQRPFVTEIMSPRGIPDTATARGMRPPTMPYCFASPLTAPDTVGSSSAESVRTLSLTSEHDPSVTPMRNAVRPTSATIACSGISTPLRPMHIAKGPLSSAPR